MATKTVTKKLSSTQAKAVDAMKELRCASKKWVECAEAATNAMHKLIPRGVNRIGLKDEVPAPSRLILSKAGLAELCEAVSEVERQAPQYRPSLYQWLQVCEPERFDKRGRLKKHDLDNVHPLILAMLEDADFELVDQNKTVNYMRQMADSARAVARRLEGFDRKNEKRASSANGKIREKQFMEGLAKAVPKFLAMKAERDKSRTKAEVERDKAALERYAKPAKKSTRKRST